MMETTSGLGGRRVALLEARMSAEMAAMIRRFGGEPVNAPAVRELPLDSHVVVGAFINGLAQHNFDLVIFLTGVGAKALFEEAERLGRLPELLAALPSVTVVCRGPKPVAVLKRREVPIALTAREPHTTAELLEALTGLDLAGKGIALIHYGERTTPLTDALRARGAQLTELCLYEWRLPEDIAPLEDILQRLIGGDVEAVAFTSQIQVRHLLQIANESGQAEALKTALNHRVVVASIGPTCTATLVEFGVSPVVVPEHPKMGHLVAALAKHYES